jgi:hypothetical protein
MLLAALIFAATVTAPLPPSAAPTPGAELPAVQQISPTQMRSEADAATSEMQVSLKRVLTMVEKARTARDIQLLNCLNEQLVQMKTLIRVAQQANVNLQEFLAKDQIEAAGHERRKIGLAREKVKSIAGQAEQCLEESGAEGGKTVVTVEKPTYPGDPTHLDTPEPGGLETPPSASPYE